MRARHVFKWIFLWPILIPLALWKQDPLAKIIAVLWTIFVCLVCLYVVAVWTEKSSAMNPATPARSVVTGKAIERETQAALIEQPDGSVDTSSPKIEHEQPTQEAISVHDESVQSTSTQSTQSVESNAAQELSGFASGGLGLTRQAWEARHTRTGDHPFGIVYDDRYIVRFRDESVSQIERQWSVSDPISPQQAVAFSSELIPYDSVLVDTYSLALAPETMVRLHISESLKDRFPADTWIGGEPGNFTVQYNVYDYGVSTVIIALGNNP